MLLWSQSCVRSTKVVVVAVVFCKTTKWFGTYSPCVFGIDDMDHINVTGGKVDERTPLPHMVRVRGRAM